jgi:hypothetical protein
VIAPFRLWLKRGRATDGAGSSLKLAHRRLPGDPAAGNWRYRETNSGVMLLSWVHGHAGTAGQMAGWLLADHERIGSPFFWHGWDSWQTWEAFCLPILPLPGFLSPEEPPADWPGIAAVAFVRGSWRVGGIDYAFRGVNLVTRGGWRETPASRAEVAAAEAFRRPPPAPVHDWCFKHHSWLWEDSIPSGHRAAAVACERPASVTWGRGPEAPTDPWPLPPAEWDARFGPLIAGKIHPARAGLLDWLCESGPPALVAELLPALDFLARHPERIVT